MNALLLGHSASRRRGALLMLLAVGAAGCGTGGPAIVSVRGKVSLDDAPLIEGVVSFVSASGFVASAPLNGDGSFQLRCQYGPGIPPGAYRVTVLPPGQEPTAQSMQSQQPSLPDSIPTTYQYANSSGLTATVREGASDFEFKLSSAR